MYEEIERKLKSKGYLTPTHFDDELKRVRTETFAKFDADTERVPPIYVAPKRKALKLLRQRRKRCGGVYENCNLVM